VSASRDTSAAVVVTGHPLQVGLRTCRVASAEHDVSLPEKQAPPWPYTLLCVQVARNTADTSSAVFQATWTRDKELATIVG
jgi:hypothetical protein